MKKNVSVVPGGLRPGDFDGNVKLLLASARAAARRREKTLHLPSDALQGGGCGALERHPEFRLKRTAAEKRFFAELLKIKNAPKVSFDAGRCAARTLEGKGPDPRFPFCGRPEEVFGIQTEGLARRLSAIGVRNIVVGLSGGLDSALALLTAHRALLSLGASPESCLHVLTMPGFGTTARTKGNAERLAEGLGLKVKTVPIASACRGHFRDIGHPAALRDVTYENAQARERTQILMDVANMVDGIVLGTGDMSEIALGWCTYNGDHMSMFGVNAGVPKTAVRDVCRWWSGRYGKEHPEAAAAIVDILDTPVSPELLPAKRGKIAQKTEERVGPYELHDWFLWHFVAERKSPAAIARGAAEAFRGAYSPAEVRKWLGVFFKRLFSQSFKRNCAPDGVKVFEVYFSPQDWWVPSDMVCPFRMPDGGEA